MLKERALGSAMAVLLAVCLVGCSDDDNKPAKDMFVPTTDAGDASVGDGGDTDALPPQAKKLILLHTNDIHDHLMGHDPNADYTPATTGDDGTIGGSARLAARIASERATAGDTPVLLLDSGDFLMGSLFTWLATTEAPSMSLLQEMGYDAVTLGNHEFEWGSAALAAFIDAGTKAGFKVPIVASNMVFDATDSGDDALEALATKGLIVNKLVRTLPNGLKVGLFGIMGKDAADLARGGKPVTFDDAAEVAKKLIKELREQDKVDLVICLSHSGIDDKGKGDDADMAAAAPGIDVILSGHSHDEVSTPIKVGETLIVQTGKYGRKLGRMDLTVEAGAITDVKYELLALDDQAKGDTATQQKIDGYITKIDALLAPAGLSYAGTVAETDFDLTFPYFQETLLGNLVTDAYLTTYNAIYTAEPAVAAVETGGFIRDPLLKGETGQLWLADVYRAVPNGVGVDQQPGTALVSFYLNGKDIKAIAELVPLAKGMLDSQVYFPQFSGMTMEYQKAGLPFISVDSVKIGNPPQPVDFKDTTTCYKVLANLYVAEMVSLVSGATGGLLKIEPKEQDCTTVITDLKTRLVDADPATAGVQELKVWQALVQYLTALPDTDSDGVPDIPSKYSTLQNRIVAK